MKSHFCMYCGHPMTDKILEERMRQVCQNCGWIFYEQLKVGGGCWIHQDGCMLLVQRANDPWKGTWYLPAGYSEVDEHPQVTAHRETYEETGLIVSASQLVDVYKYDMDPRGNGILILYECMSFHGTIQPGPEAQKVQFFPPDAIRQMVIAPAHQEAISDCVKRMTDGRMH